MKTILQLLRFLFVDLAWQVGRSAVSIFRLSRKSISAGVSIQFPVTVSGSGAISLGEQTVVGRNVRFACGQESELRFGRNCYLGEGSTFNVAARQRMTFGEGVGILEHCSFAAAGEWRVGDGTHIGSYCRIGDREPGRAGKLEVGSRTFIGDFSVLDTTGGLHVGDNVAIGPLSIIYTHDHEPDTKTESSWSGRLTTGAVTIGNGAWIGARVTILAGVTIGNYAVIGAGAVVTRDVPPACLALGVPAKVVKQHLT
jgi:acetyltransferase-like isoleucine patch superfamily enzyme